MQNESGVGMNCQLIMSVRWLL